MLDEKILNAIDGKSCVVTGGSGMIGREVVGVLAEAGATVRSVSLDKGQEIHPRAEQIYGDLTDFAFCKDVTQGADWVFHVAGIKGSVEVTKSKPASFLVPLLMMNTNMLEAARLNNCERVVYTSSIGAYGSAEVFVESEDDEIDAAPPMDMFPGWAKRIAEMQCQAYRIQYGVENFSIVRPCNVYGPGDNFDPKNAMVIPTILSRIANKEDPVVVWGDGSAIRDFLYAKDCAHGVIQALFYGTRGSYVNLGSGIGVSIRELIETMASIVDFNYEFDTAKPAGFPRRVMDISRARSWIHFEPATSLRDGLQETWTWFLSNRDAYLSRNNYFADEERGASA